MVEREQKYQLVPFEGSEWAPKIAEYTKIMAGIFFPFDYGRFEFRLDERNGKLHMLEVNLNCNLWSQKVFGKSAELVGWSHADLIETILCESLLRQGVLTNAEAVAA